MNWLEVSLTVSGELAEAVAEVLARYAENGVAVEQGIRQLDDEEVGVADGPVTVRAYLADDERLQTNRQKVEEALHFLGMIQALPEPTFRAIAEQNWMEAWKSRYQPIPIGRRLMVLPSWIELTEPSRIAVKINPAMAFGTGTHPSTQLCLEFLDKILDPGRTSEGKRQTPAPSTFIDIGCGSGILSIAAIKLGVDVCLGVDIDAVSIENARENASLNGIEAKVVLEVGSVADVLTGRFGPRTASLVAANILAPVIVRLFGEGLVELVAPGGSIILSGILEPQADKLIQAARHAGLTLTERRQKGEWVALLMAR